MEIKLAASATDIEKCMEVLKVLRPHLDEETFVSMVTEMLHKGYKLAYIEEDKKAVAAIGYRHLQFLYNGKHIYIDDLVTLEAYRGRGHAGALLDFVEEEAKQHGYKTVTLDSGHHRTTAHRLYLNKKYAITAHHFVKNI